MKISNIFRFKEGSAVVRVLPRAKTIRRIYALTAAVNFASAANCAKRGEGFNTFCLGAFSMYFIRQVEKLHKGIVALQPRYDQIVARARKIKFKD